jgi:hypothetical protein
MTAPVWSTSSGNLATINPRQYFSLQLQAVGAGTLSYSKIAGTLPPGIELTTSGVLRGVPFETITRILYTFSVRVSDGTNITDRTFNIEVLGPGAPLFATPSGLLDLSGPARSMKWAMDGTIVSYQIRAVDLVTATGTALIYDIAAGALPPGLTISSSGLISGTVNLGNLSSSSYVNNYTFTVRVTDGSNTAEQPNSILVFSSHFFTVDNTNIKVSATEYNSFPITMDISSYIQPVFLTDTVLLSGKSGNDYTVQLQIQDADAYLGNLQYSIISGSLPAGLQLDSTSGVIYGILPLQNVPQVNYSFTVRALRMLSEGLSVYADKLFSLKVYSDINTNITFVTPSNLGTILPNIPSLLNIVAASSISNSIITYSLTGGSLPSGLTLTESGHIIGQVTLKDYISIDHNATTFDSGATTLDRVYQFSVAATDQSANYSTEQNFKITVALPYSVSYGNLSARGLISYIDTGQTENIFYQISQDPDINSTDYIYRTDDPNFGIRLSLEMLVVAGLEYQTLTALQTQMQENHYIKNLYFGDVKTAVAKDLNGNIVYEVVYIEMVDNLVNNQGKSISKTIDLPIDTNISLDEANWIAFPNSIENMRAQMKLLDNKEFVYLPLWMRTAQDNSGIPLGYTMSVVLAYCVPGQSGLVRRRILDKNIDFKKIQFTIDRYDVQAGRIDSNILVGDGSTVAFSLNEIVHEEEIEVKLNNQILKYVENPLTADSLAQPSYLTADTLLVSTDYQAAFYLTHNTVNNTTTVVFSTPPAENTIINVYRTGDKYLAFDRNLGS